MDINLTAAWASERTVKKRKIIWALDVPSALYFFLCRDMQTSFKAFTVEQSLYRIKKSKQIDILFSFRKVN